MKPENEMTEEVRQLLDSLEEHGKNARRQKQLSDLIDSLSEEEQGTTTSLRETRRVHRPKGGNSAEHSGATRQPEGSSTEGRKSNLTQLRVVARFRHHHVDCLRQHLKFEWRIGQSLTLGLQQQLMCWN